MSGESMGAGPHPFEDPKLVRRSSKRRSTNRCIQCRGARMLCGKRRCPIMARIYSNVRTAPLIDTLSLAGSSPPSVFVGRVGYPKVDVGPMIPPRFGDTHLLDTPEEWVGQPIESAWGVAQLQV